MSVSHQDIRKLFASSVNQILSPRSVLVSMLRPSGTAGSVLVDDGETARWSAAAAANGSVLTSDTSQTGGVKWATGTSRMKAGTLSVPGSTGSFSVSGLGFKPILVMFTSGWNGTLTSDSMIANGGVDAGGTQWVHATCVNAAGRSMVHATDCCILLTNQTGSPYYRAAFTSMDSSGFTVNFTVANSSGRVSWIAFG